MPQLDSIEVSVGDVLYTIAEQVGPSLAVRREATRARGDFAPSDDYPMTGPEMRAFLNEYVADDPYLGEVLLRKRESHVIALPTLHFDQFVRKLSAMACRANWLGAAGPHYVPVRKHLPDLKRRGTSNVPFGTKNRPEIDEAVQIHAPSLSVLLNLFRQKVDLDKLNWRQLEGLIAELLKAEGYEVELGRGSKDGGADIIAHNHIPTVGLMRTVWQAKHFTNGNKVGLSIVRELADVRNEFLATKGFIVTTSFLTKGALNRIKRDEYTLGKIERHELEDWIQRTLGGRKGSL